METCELPFETLLDFAEERLDAKAAERVRTHLATGCAACADAYAWMDRTLPALRRSEDELRVPQRLRARARAIMPAEPKPQRATLPTVLARLVFDGRAGLSYAGARAAGAADIRAHFATNEHDVDIWQEQSSDGRWYLIGHILPRSGEAPQTPAAVTLIDPRGNEQTIAPDLPEFHLPGIAAETYRLELKLPDRTIVIPDLDVGI